LAKNDNFPDNTRDVEFKISISTKDIDDIIQQIKNMKSDSKHSEVKIMETGDE